MAKPKDKTVLVVDDEEDVRDYLATVLEDSGFNVVTAEDGAAALHRVESSVPDLISLDLVMPKKSGMRFLHELRRRQEWRDIPVLVVTAHAHDELGGDDFVEIFSGRMAAGPSSFLEKPVDPHEYLALICEKLGVDIESEAGEDDSGIRGRLHDIIDSLDARKLSQAHRMLQSLH